MVCTKCQKKQSQTKLATPSVKRKNDLYYGSPSGNNTTSSKGKPSATLGQTGVTKNKLLSKSAKNPYAAFSSYCKTCSSKIEQGRTLCQKCAYRSNTCAMCGKDQNKSKAQQPVVQGQKFTMK